MILAQSYQIKRHRVLISACKPAWSILGRPMDPFDDQRGDLTGSLISLEFGPGGRVTQLWASDPALPDEGEEFQFVLPPVAFGEESSDDYLPGTILVGARTGPEQPWIVSRNINAQRLFPFGEDDLDSNSVEFDYELPTLEDIQIHGRWYETPGAFPQIAWDLDVKNRGRISLEIGELGFPIALNNFFDGFGWSDELLQKLWKSRVHIHKAIGGGASWLFAQRMTAETPGLLVFPGDQTSWEFYSHVPGSLTTTYQWEGIPVVYCHSKATIEREQWPNWANEHTSLILEPGDSRKFQMRFVPCDSDKQDGVNATLVACGKPGIRVLPSAVAPIDVGVGLEIAGASPKKFYLSRDAQLETDGDEEGAFCFVKPTESGPLKVSFRDNSGVLCHVHLMFTEPIESLIKSRAGYIVAHQVVKDGMLKDAIVMADIRNNTPVTDAEEYRESSGIDCSLADVLFLAEKNAVYPDRDEIALLDNYITEFLLRHVQNPSNLAVGSVIEDQSATASHFGRPLGYPHVFNVYHSMYRIAKHYGETKRGQSEYLQLAHGTATAMFKFGWRLYVRTVGVLGYARVYDLYEDLLHEGLIDEAEDLLRSIDFKATELTKLNYPYAGESVMDTSGFEEVVAAARHVADDEHLERAVRCAYATKSLSPSWWWYGSDKRSWDGADSTPLRAQVDRGEACHSHTTIPNSLIFFGLMDRDYLALPEAYMRAAFGGMLGPWALVRRDGGASMCYCPDLSSKHAGYNSFTGSSGVGYFHYLRGTGAYVLPNRALGTSSFGCHFEASENKYSVQPWDGVRRRIVMRQIGAEFHLSFGQFERLELATDLRRFVALVKNPSDKDIAVELVVTGLWGTRVELNHETAIADNGRVVFRVTLPKLATTKLEGQVTA